MDDEALYRDLAAFYDKIYHWKDYAAEAARLIALLQAEGLPPGSRVLEAACGTGSHLQHLSGSFSLAGFDKQATMVEQARAKAPAAALWVADMEDFAVEEPFDGLLCLFGSIGYLREDGALEAGLRRFAAALRPGGVLIIEPWLAPEVYEVGRVSLDRYQDDALTLARMAFAEREDDDSVLAFHWLVGRRGQGVERFVERHRLRMTTEADFLAALDRAGFAARFAADGLMKNRGLYIGRRR